MLVTWLVGRKKNISCHVKVAKVSFSWGIQARRRRFERDTFASWCRRLKVLLTINFFKWFYIKIPKNFDYSWFLLIRRLELILLQQFFDFYIPYIFPFLLLMPYLVTFLSKKWHLVLQGGSLKSKSDIIPKCFCGIIEWTRGRVPKFTSHNE